MKTVHHNVRYILVLSLTHHAVLEKDQETSYNKSDTLDHGTNHAQVAFLPEIIRDIIFPAAYTL